MKTLKSIHFGEQASALKLIAASIYHGPCFWSYHRSAKEQNCAFLISDWLFAKSARVIEEEEGLMFEKEVQSGEKMAIKTNYERTLQSAISVEDDTNQHCRRTYVSNTST